MGKLTVQDIKDMQLQISCANEVEFTEVKDVLVKVGLKWVFLFGTDVIQVFNDGEFTSDKELDTNFGVVISATEFLKRFVYSD